MYVHYNIPIEWKDVLSQVKLSREEMGIIINKLDTSTSVSACKEMVNIIRMT
jgi:hypothetical protein